MEDESSSFFGKIFLTFFIIVGLIILIPLAGLLIATVGGSEEFGKYKAEILIKKPPREVYIWLIDKPKRTKWDMNLKESTQLTPGGDSMIGSRSEEVINIQSRDITTQMEIKKIIWNSSLSIKQTTKSFENNFTYTLVNQNGNTKLTVEGDMNFLDAFGTLFSPIITYVYKDAREDSLRKLKEQVEFN